MLHKDRRWTATREGHGPHTSAGPTHRQSPRRRASCRVAARTVLAVTWSFSRAGTESASSHAQSKYPDAWPHANVTFDCSQLIGWRSRRIGRRSVSGASSVRTSAVAERRPAAGRTAPSPLEWRSWCRSSRNSHRRGPASPRGCHGPRTRWAACDISAGTARRSRRGPR